MKAAKAANFAAFCFSDLSGRVFSAGQPVFEVQKNEFFSTNLRILIWKVLYIF